MSNIEKLTAEVGELREKLDILLSQLTERTISGNRIYSSKIPGDVPNFGTAEKLEELLAEQFECYDGHPRYCHTVVTANAEIQYPYRVLGLIAPSWIKNDPQEHLRKAVWTCLMRLKRQTKEVKPTLYWRRHIEEAVGDHGHKISLRIAIPSLCAADWAFAYGMLVIDGEAFPILGM